MKQVKLLTGLLAAGLLLAASCAKTTNTKQPAQQQTNNNNNNNPEPAPLSFTKLTSPVILEYTSTGCPGCGSWGKPTFAKLTKDFEGKVTPLAVHIKYGDPMITAESNEIAANRHGDFYTPQIWVMDKNAIILNGGSISSQSEQNARTLIDAALMQEQPALAAVVKKESGKLEVTYGVKFIDVTADGEYGIACYLTEDGIKHQQTSSATNPATHNHVIRASASGAFGNKFTASDLQENSKAWTHSFDISSFNAAYVYVTVVLWKKTGERFEPLNGFVAK